MTLPRTLAALMMACLTAPSSSAAQTTQAEVTLKVPVNLTQLGPDVSKIIVGCSIRSDAITTGGTNREVTRTQELPVSGGAVVTTASIVFSFTGLDNPVGKSASIVCSLNGWSASQGTWTQFTPGAANPAFRTTTTVSMIDASYTW